MANPIKRWWDSLDAFDQDITWYSFKLALVAAILAGVSVFTVMKLFEANEAYKATRPCSDFANWTIKDIPVRCLSDYGITIIHD